MGMFDYVNYEAPCGKCGTMLGPEDWQSKDHHCTMATISPRKVRRFYASCDNCGEWNEFKVKVESYRVKRVRPEGDNDPTTR